MTAGAHVAAIIASVTLVTLSAQTASGRLNVCHAGSLLAAFTQLEEEFKQQHPAITIVDTSGGSIDLVRRFAAEGLECDVIAPADHLVIDRLLKPAKLADYSIVFARGRMVLAYLATDPKANALPLSGTFGPPSSVPLVTGNWYETLTAPGSRISGAHPFMDPGGYRAHMIFEASQAHYKVPGLHNDLLRHYQVNVADPSVTPPALGKDFNFQFTYEHTAARAAKLDAAYRYAALPPDIDLSMDNRRYAAGATVPGLGIPGSSPSVAIPASAVAWGVTIPTNSRNRDNAIAFVSALLGPIGRAALTKNGPAPLVPARVTREDDRRLPPVLQSLTTVN